jgi:hypothetical protein
MFSADYELITDTGNDAFVDIWIDRALRYWTTEPKGILEVLIGGDVRVVRAVQ